MENLSSTADDHQRRELLILREKFNQLQNRIDTARVVDLSEQPPNEVRFGAKVTYQIPHAKKPVTIQIVGVDEDDIRNRKIAFIYPIVTDNNGNSNDNIIVMLH